MARGTIGILTMASPGRAGGAGALRAGVTTSHYLVYLSSNS
ncbi:hypothetical protein [Paenarthrobacter aurescens]|nr:hypothetical protein [Paenarthrobacter aurescens]